MRSKYKLFLTAIALVSFLGLSTPAVADDPPSGDQGSQEQGDEKKEKKKEKTKSIFEPADSGSAYVVFGRTTTQTKPIELRDDGPGAPGDGTIIDEGCGEEPVEQDYETYDEYMDAWFAWMDCEISQLEEDMDDFLDN